MSKNCLVVWTKTHIRTGARIRAGKEYGFRLEGFRTPAEDPCRKKSHRQVLFVDDVIGKFKGIH